MMTWIFILSLTVAVCIFIIAMLIRQSIDNGCILSSMCDRLRSKACNDGCCYFHCSRTCQCENKPDIIADDAVERAIARTRKKV